MAADPAAGDVFVTDVRIFQPSKTAMQSGRRKTHQWMVQFERDAPQVPDPLMGWMGSRDTRPQLRLLFEFAGGSGRFRRTQWPFLLRAGAACDRRLRPKSYAENFRA